MAHCPQIEDMNRQKQRHYKYEIKCKKCGKIKKLHFGYVADSDYKNFVSFIEKESLKPIHRVCECDDKMTMLHDIISYGCIEV